MKKNTFILSLILGLFTSTIQSQSWFHADSILSHIRYLASEELKGRGTGTEGEKLAADYIINRFAGWGLQPAGENNTWTQSFDFATGTHGLGGRTGKANNVIAFLNNGAPYTVVIGGHYDHLGEGNDGHSLDPHSAGQIHNGADDNASGTAGVLELARYFSKNDEKEPFNFLFICFSGEELGLLGSAHYVNNPTIDLNTITCMINMDMVGRLNKDKPELQVSGIGTAPEWDKLVSKFSSGAMAIRTDSAGVGPSDHSSFYNKGIPVLHFFTGTHGDYHKPGDDVEKINAPGEEAVLMVITGVVAGLPSDRKLEYLKTRNPSTSSTTSFKVTLGIMPSYASSTTGLKVEAVLDDKPAFKAGMKDGDVIVKMGKMKVTDIQSYMKALAAFKKGDTTKVIVKRDGKEVKLEVTF